MVKRFCWCCNTWRNCRVRKHTMLHSYYYSSQKFSSTCDEEFSRLLRASKSENSDRCKYSFPHLHWKQEYPIYCQILFRISETFPFSFVFLLQSFSLKPHKTRQPVFGRAKFGRRNDNGLCAIHSVEIFTNKQTVLTAARVLGG